MKRIIVAAAIAALSFGFAPSNATPGNGCVATDEAGTGGPAVEGAALTCDYIAAASKAQIVQATPNAIHVREVSPNGQIVHENIYEQITLSFPGTVEFATTPGYTVYVTVGPDDAEGFIQGAVGFVGVGETA